MKLKTKKNKTKVQTKQKMEGKYAILEHTARQTGQTQQDCDMSKSLICESIDSTIAFKEFH